MVVYCDLCLTLIDAQHRPYPYVPEALEALSKFVTGKGKPLQSCLVSDVRDPASAVEAPQIEAEYYRVLEQAGLRTWFEPVAQRVTLSLHADAHKPDATIFQAALRRLGSRARLRDCLLITEDAEQVRKVRAELEMRALKFRSAGSSEFDFDDWAQLPLLVASQLGSRSSSNLEHALAVYLRARHDLELTALEPSSTPETVRFRATSWVAVAGETLGELSGVRVAFAVEGEVARRADGQVETTHFSEPSAEELRETTNFVASLVHHGQLETHAKGQHARGTHQIVVDARGQRRLVRSGFSVR
jgi:hypothetical protein